jgi:hypothetical protein
MPPVSQPVDVGIRGPESAFTDLVTVALPLDENQLVIVVCSVDCDPSERDHLQIGGPTIGQTEEGHVAWLRAAFPQSVPHQSLGRCVSESQVEVVDINVCICPIKCFRKLYRWIWEVVINNVHGTSPKCREVTISTPINNRAVGKPFSLQHGLPGGND